MKNKHMAKNVLHHSNFFQDHANASSTAQMLYEKQKLTPDAPCKVANPSHRNFGSGSLRQLLVGMV